MHLLDLVAIHESLMDAAGRATGRVHCADRIPMYGWHRDHLITWIRDMEDPR